MATAIADQITELLMRQPKEGIACAKEYARVREELYLLMDALKLVSMRSASDDSDIYFPMMLMATAFDLQHVHFLQM